MTENRKLSAGYGCDIEDAEKPATFTPIPYTQKMVAIEVIDVETGTVERFEIGGAK